MVGLKKNKKKKKKKADDRCSLKFGAERVKMENEPQRQKTYLSGMWAQRRFRSACKLPGRILDWLQSPVTKYIFSYNLFNNPLK